MHETSPDILNKIYFRYRNDSPHATNFRGFKSQLSRDIIEANGRNGNLKLDLDKLLKSTHQDFFHDIDGIRNYLNRETGVLATVLTPRCAIPNSRINFKLKLRAVNNGKTHYIFEILDGEERYSGGNPELLEGATWYEGRSGKWRWSQISLIMSLTRGMTVWNTNVENIKVDYEGIPKY